MLPKITRLKRYLNLKSFRKGKEVLLSLKSSITTLHYIISINVLSTIIRDALKFSNVCLARCCLITHHTMGQTTEQELEEETMFGLPLVSLDQSVCQLQAGIIWLMAGPLSFRNPPWGKLQITSLIIPDVEMQWLLSLAWMTFNQQSEQQGLSLLRPKTKLF